MEKVIVYPRSMKLAERIKTFPKDCGVYLFKDKDGKVIYVGKAIDLRSRVRSYFAGTDSRPQVQFLVKRAFDIEYIITDNEKEALLLENTLIKKHKPKYNVFLKDDKTYPSIRIDMAHEFPGLSMTRRVLKDGARYYGPYSSASAARELYEQVIIAFKLRSCSDTVFSNRIRPCLEFDLKRCAAPCVGKISHEDYLEAVNGANDFLKGGRRDIYKILQVQMKKASEQEDFEGAARIRDVIFKMKEAHEKQRVIGFNGGDADYFSVLSIKNDISISILKVRKGLLIGKSEYFVKEVKVDPQEQVGSLLIQHYSDNDVPQRIFIKSLPDNLKAVEDILTSVLGHKVKILTPRLDRDRGLLELALKNAAERADREGKVGRSYDEMSKGLSANLNIRKAVDLIECLDISNIQGKDAYGSLVAFYRGSAEKSRYRLYKIQSLFEPDDYGMMKEVLERRYHRGENELLDPDLLLIDGGKGHLNMACRVLTHLGLEIPVAAIAKGKAGRQDEIYLPNRKNPLKFKKGSKLLLFLMKVRDEAHRFGIKAFRKGHQRSTFAR